MKWTTDAECIDDMAAAIANNQSEEVNENHRQDAATAFAVVAQYLEWWHVDDGTECVAGHDPTTMLCAQDGGAVSTARPFLPSSPGYPIARGVRCVLHPFDPQTVDDPSVPAEFTAAGYSVCLRHLPLVACGASWAVIDNAMRRAVPLSE